MKLEKKQNIVFTIVALICIVLFCTSISPKTLQNDTYYTIKIGEYIMQNGVSNLTEDPFSWHELSYTYPHWLYDLGVYIIYNNFGHLGIYISTIVLTSLLGISVYLLCSKLSKNKVISLIITIGSLYLMKSFIAARAQLVTFVLFTLTLYSIEMFLETHKKRYAIYLIIIPLLIANLHCAVFPFYFVLYMPYVTEFIWMSIIDMDIDKRLFGELFKLIKRISKKKDIKERCNNKIEKIKYQVSERNRKREILRNNPFKVKVQKNKYVLWLIIIMLIATATGLINPAGNGAYTYLYKTMQGNTTQSINEHLPMTLIDNKEFLFTLCLFLSILIFTDTKIKVADLFMLLGLAYLSFQSKRQVSMFALLCAPILAKMIASMFEKYDSGTYKKLLKFGSSLFGAIIIISSFMIISIKMIKPKLNDSYVDNSTYPVEASDWILNNLDVNNIKLYNEYNYGSYLLFRGIPVFIDSRADLYAPEFNEDKNNEIDGRDIFSDALNIAGISVNYKTKFVEYDVTHIITYSNAKLAMLLQQDSDYNTIYNQGNFKIFERMIDSRQNY